MSTITFTRVYQKLFLCGLSIFIVSCAANGTNPRDPYENFNRKVFDVNEKIDKEIVKPLSQFYVDITPQMARTGINNVIENISDIKTMANGILQLKPKETLESFFRVLINTTMGFGGLLDLASRLQIPKSNLGFASTLKRYHVPQGNYIVWPVIGPATYRSSAGVVVDGITSPIRAFNQDVQIGYTGVSALNTRANLLDVEKAVEQGGIFDKYSFMRDVFLKYDDGKLNKANDEEYKEENMDWYEDK